MKRTLVCALFLLVLGTSACGVKRLQRTATEPDAVETVDRAAPFLKVHTRSGQLYVLSPWTADETERRVTGTGKQYGPDRMLVQNGAFLVPFDSVVLFETNVVRPSPSVAALGIVTGITVGVAVICATNPKACFGSCPTFYLTDGTRDLLQAEGFSASISPRLEARDIDALFRARPTGREVRMEMVNEAYETHVVRYANLVAVPRPPNGRVFSDDAGVYWSGTEPAPATRCTAAEGDCSAKLAKFDDSERSSVADSTDLAAREVIDLEFNATGDTPGLVLASRQSLLPTYILYQTFAWLGNSVGDWLAKLERADTTTAKRTAAVVATLGGIDILVRNATGGWDSVATVRETGPLAADVRVVPLPVPSGPVHVRLRMAKGAWRIDAAALTSLSTRHPQALRVQPSQVLTGDGPDRLALARLVSERDPLVTFPGDRYTLVYRLPADASAYELFLDTKGYYLEWMRNEWIAEESLARAAGLFLDPAAALRRLAPEFKRAEPGLEAAFWGSKYVAR